MTADGTPQIAWILAASVLSVSLVVAFNAGDSGGRTVTASVVNDSTAYLALEPNGNSAHKNFVSTTGGKISVSFGSGVASGTGITQDGTFMFDSIINITNKGTVSFNVDITISGTDSTLCEVALTTTTTQADTNYSNNPTPTALAVGSKLYLGLEVKGTGKTSGQSVSCTITVTAAR